MKNVVQETIEKLKKTNAKPLPRWKFVLKRLSIWFMAGVIAFFSAIALAVIFFLVAQFDWDIYENGRNLFFFGVRFIPYFWIAIVAMLVFGTFEIIRHTKSGYKYDWIKVIVVVLGVSLGFGILAHFAKFGEYANDIAQKKFPGYGNMIHTMEDQWSQAENGFLAGEILSVNENSILLKDFGGKIWNIEISGSTLIMPMAKIEKGFGIKIIGKIVSENNFSAQQIRPWRGKMMQKKINMNGKSFPDKREFKMEMMMGRRFN